MAEICGLDKPLDAVAGLGDRRVGGQSMTDRYESLDAIRGVAVMGILAMNIVAFAMPMSAYFNPAAGGAPSTSAGRRLSHIRNPVTDRTTRPRAVKTPSAWFSGPKS